MSEASQAMEEKKKSAKEACPVVLMDFSGIYHSQGFYHHLEKTQLYWADVGNISGTNCYCDDEAEKQLLKIIRKFPLTGIHFLDSGNYHYMTRIWLTLLDQPFRLLVFDNHTDLQPPAFGRILSCGSWIDSSLRELPDLKEVFLIGPDKAAYAQIDDERKDHICFLSREQINGMSLENWTDYFTKLPMDLPWYLSIDKDILCPEDARTTWSQGELHLSWLLAGLQAIQKEMPDGRRSILGTDICGECDPDRPEGIEINDSTNQRLLEVLKKFYA